MQDLSPTGRPTSQTIKLQSADRGELDLHRFDPALATDSLAPFLNSSDNLGFPGKSPFLAAAKKAYADLLPFPNAKRSVDQALQRFFESQLELGERDCPILASGSFSQGMKLRITPKDQGTLATMLGSLVAEVLRCSGDAVSIVAAKRFSPEFGNALEAASVSNSFSGTDLDFVHGLLANLGKIGAKVPQNTRAANICDALSSWTGAAAQPTEAENSGVELPAFVAERQYAVVREAQYFDRRKLLAKICQIELGTNPETIERLTSIEEGILKAANYISGCGLPIGVVAGMVRSSFMPFLVAAGISAVSYAAYGIARWALRIAGNSGNGRMSEISKELEDNSAMLKRAREYVPFAKDFSVDP